MVTILLASVFFITLSSFYGADSYHIHEFNQRMDSSEELLQSSTIYIYRGIKLWDSTYDYPIERIAYLVYHEYQELKHEMSAVNLREIALSVSPEYRGRVRIDIINESGIIAYTYNGTLGVDFSKWKVFYQDLTRIRTSDQFVPDRVVNGFDNSAPLMKYGYLPTDDHRYVIEPSLDVGMDQVRERNETSYLSLITRVKNQNQDLQSIQIYNSLGNLIFSTNGTSPPSFSWTSDMVHAVNADHQPKEMKDARNQTQVRYQFLDVSEDDSPSAKYMDLVAELEYSTKRLNDRQHSNFVIHVVLGILAAVSLLIFGYLLLSRLTHPIQQMVRDIDKISSGDLAHPISPVFHLELNQIAHAVNRMVSEIRDHLHTIQNSKSQYVSLFQSSADSLLIIEGDKVIMMNQAASRLFHVTEGEIFGISINNLFGDIGQVIAEMIRDLSKSESDTYVERIIEQVINNEVMDISIRLNRVPVDDRSLVLVQIRDITDQQRIFIAHAEKEILQSEIQQLKIIMQVFPDPTFVIDAQGKVIVWNAAMEKMSGVLAHDILGKERSSYNRVSYLSDHQYLIDMALDQQKNITCFNPDITKKGDILRLNTWIDNPKLGKLYISAAASRFYDRHGNVAGALESIRDLTPLKKAEEDLLLAHNKLSILFSITRHDILNKVMIAKSYLFLIGMDRFDDKVPGMFDAIDQALSAIQQFTNFTQMYQELGSKSPEWQDVREVFTRVISSLEAPGVNIRVEVQGLCIYADLLFEKVCYNLIENAIRHGEHTTEILISTQKIPAGVRVSVKDNGSGIPEEEKQIIFEKGYGKNTGFGLFLTKEILSLSNIRISETGIPGSYARFDMDFPEDHVRFFSPDQNADP